MEAGSLKIKITSDSDPVLKDLEKVEAAAQKTFDRAKAAAEKTALALDVLGARMDVLKSSKRADLDIGLKWDETALDGAIDRALDMDSSYRRLIAAVERLEDKLAAQKQEVSRAGAAHEEAAQKINEHTAASQKNASMAEKVRDAFISVAKRLGMSDQSIQKVMGAASKARSIFSSLAERLGKLCGTVKKTAGETRKADRATKQHTSSMRQSAQAANPLAKSILRVGNMFRLMLLNMVMRAAIDGVKEGFSDLAQYSDAFGNTMSRLSTSFLYVRNAITTVFKPVLEAIAPLIEQVADWFAKAADSAAQLAAALFGTGASYTTATKALKKYGEEAKKTAKQNDRALASFDQINQLSVDKPESGQPTPDDMFEEKPIEQEVKDFAERIRELFAELMEYAQQLGAVFQQSWAQFGGATLDAAKAALGEILNLLGQIGRSFMEVWTNGTGTKLLQAAGDALNNIIWLVTSIGQAFIDAWNEGGLGQSIMGHLISIATGLLEIIGNLAGRFTEAWNEGGNGQKIMSALLGILDSVLGTIDNIVGATADWAKTLNLEPLLGAIGNLLTPISTILDVIGGVLSDIWSGIILPCLKWLIESALPFVINLLGAVLKLIADHPEVIKAVTQAVITLFAVWQFAKVITGLKQLGPRRVPSASITGFNTRASCDREPSNRMLICGAALPPPDSSRTIWRIRFSGASRLRPPRWSPSTATNSLFGGITAPVARRGTGLLRRS